jgi:hypothetical protein
MRLSKTPSLMLTGFVIILGFMAQDARAQAQGWPSVFDCQK